MFNITNGHTPKTRVLHLDFEASGHVTSTWWIKVYHSTSGDILGSESIVSVNEMNVIEGTWSEYPYPYTIKYFSSFTWVRKYFPGALWVKGTCSDFYRPGKVIFHKIVSRILSTGGCLPQCMLGYTHPWVDTPPWKTPHPADTPLTVTAVDGTHPTGAGIAQSVEHSSAAWYVPVSSLSNACSQVPCWSPRGRQVSHCNSAIHKAAGLPAAVQNDLWRPFCTAVPHRHFSVLQGTAR